MTMQANNDFAVSINIENEQQKQTIFDKIYNKFYKLVWFCAYRFLGNKEDTDEVSDDVFVKFYFRLGKTEIQNAKYYLTRAARNLSVNKLRVKEQTEELDEKTAVGEYFYFEDNDVLEKIKKLASKDEIEMLIRHIIEGYSLTELADIKSESINTVKSKYRRLIEKLKSNLGEFYDE